MKVFILETNGKRKNFHFELKKEKEKEKEEGEQEDVSHMGRQCGSEANCGVG